MAIHPDHRHPDYHPGVLHQYRDQFQSLALCPILCRAQAQVPKETHKYISLM